MEIPALKGVVDFDGVVYRTLSVSDNIEVSMWGPLLILALIAGIVNAVKLLAVKVGSVNTPSRSEQPLLEHDSDADTCPSEDEEYEVVVDDEDDDVVVAADDFRVRGSDQWQFRNFGTGDDHSFSVGADQGVVKLWDNVGSGFDSGAVKSILAVGSRGVEVRVWDRRVSWGVPAILAEWRVGEVGVGDVRMAHARSGRVKGWGSGGDVTVTWDWEGESCDSVLRRRQVSPDVRFVNCH